jgi:gas vesicle protein
MAAEDWVKGLIAGGLMGAVLGVLYAPRSGKETRDRICKSSEELFEKTKEQVEQGQRKMEELAERGKELYAEKKEKLKKAVEVGVEAYKQEKLQAPQA